MSVELAEGGPGCQPCLTRAAEEGASEVNRILHTAAISSESLALLARRPYAMSNTDVTMLVRATCRAVRPTADLVVIRVTTGLRKKPQVEELTRSPAWTLRTDRYGAYPAYAASESGELRPLLARGVLGLNERVVTMIERGQPVVAGRYRAADGQGESWSAAHFEAGAGVAVLGVPTASFLPSSIWRIAMLTALGDLV